MMKPTLEELRAACPEVDPRLVDQHLRRLGDSYFERFGIPDVARHLAGLAELRPDRPVRLLWSTDAFPEVTCTVLAFDYPSEFSLITGTLAGMAFAITSGDVYTYERAPDPAPRRGWPLPRRILTRSDPLRRRRIIDTFHGRVYDADTGLDAWLEETRRRLCEVLGLLEKGDAASAQQAKQMVNEMVTRRLASPGGSASPVLYPVEI